MSYFTKIRVTTFSIILFLMLSFDGISQQKPSFDIVLGGNHSGRILMESYSSSSSNRNVGINTLGYGVYYNHPIRKNWMFRTGISLNKTGYRQKYSFSFVRSDVSMGSFPITSNDVVDYFVDTRITQSFVELPLTFRYCRKKDKISPFFEFGLSSSLYVTSNEKGIRNGKSININRRIDDEAFRKVNFALLLAFGAEYDVNEAFSLFSRPSFKIDFLSAVKSEHTRRYNYSIGFEMGLRTFLN